MQLPMNTSSIFCPATSDSSRASSGSFGAHRIGSCEVRLQYSEQMHEINTTLYTYYKINNLLTYIHTFIHT